LFNNKKKCRDMKTDYFNLRHIKMIAVTAFLGVAASSCTAYKNASASDNDGIYEGAQQRQDAGNYDSSNGNGQMDYKAYFSSLQNQYPATALTDVESYTSYTDSTAAPAQAYNAAPGWGESNDNVTVNVYGGYNWGYPYYGGWGYGYGYPYYWNSWYPGWSVGWNSWYGGGWGWNYPYYGNYHNHYYYGGGRPGYYAGGPRGYSNGSRGYYNTGRYATGRPTYNANGTRSNYYSNGGRFNGNRSYSTQQGGTRYNNGTRNYNNGGRNYNNTPRSNNTYTPSRSYTPTRSSGTIAPSRSSGGSFGGGRPSGGGGGGYRGGGGGGRRG